MNAVQPGSFLTLHYRLAGPDGADIVNTFPSQPATLSIGGGELAPAIEARLIGLREGEHRTFDLAAGEAFGDRNPRLVQRVALELLRRHGDPEATYQQGDMIRFAAPDGRPDYAGVVREAGESSLLIDFNHPLAGTPLVFEVRLIGVL